MIASRYERVKFIDGDKRRTVYLRVTRETALFLTGVEVDREGDEVASPGYDSRTRVIDKSLIRARVSCIFDLKYGWLVPRSAP